MQPKSWQRSVRGGASGRLSTEEVHHIRTTDVQGKNRDISFVSESGLDKLVLKSRKPSWTASRERFFRALENAVPKVSVNSHASALSVHGSPAESACDVPLAFESGGKGRLTLRNPPPHGPSPLRRANQLIGKSGPRIRTEGEPDAGGLAGEAGIIEPYSASMTSTPLRLSNTSVSSPSTPMAASSVAASLSILTTPK